jgi:hypothetical protein
LAALTITPGRATAQNLPSPFLLSPTTAHTAAVSSPAFAYGLMAYALKEFLDDASFDYERSPVGAHLERVKPGQSFQSERPFPGAVVPAAIPSYRVRPDATLRDLLWGSQRGIDNAGAGHLSMQPKLGAGRAGLILTFRW